MDLQPRKEPDMKLKSLCLGLLFVAASMTSAFANTACDYPVPRDTRQDPRDFGWQYSIRYVPQRSMSGHCHFVPDHGRYSAGCAVWLGGSRYLIFVNSEQSSASIACTITYEKAHLPPNSWLDPKMEAAGRRID
jgi:hypothetical protein